MLGLEDPGICWAYILSGLSALACIVYGIINWNRGAIDEDEIDESKEWARDEDKINDSF